MVEDLGPLVEWQGWYMDDAHVVGTLPQLHAVISTVQTRGALLGLELNLSKCVLWGPAVGDNNRGGRSSFLVQIGRAHV